MDASTRAPAESNNSIYVSHPCRVHVRVHALRGIERPAKRLDVPPTDEANADAS
jgi:hypothetical protein